MENIPSYLLDLLNQKTFGQLTSEEKTEVLQHMSETAYNDLHEAAQVSGILHIDEKDLPTNTQQKQLLMEKFRQKNAKTYSMNSPVAFWKAAASFLLFGLAIYFLTLRSVISQPTYLTTIDTLYIEKEMPALKIFDTIYITQKQELNTSGQPLKKNMKHEKEVLPQLHISSENNNLNRLSISDYKLLERHKKKRSIKDDSLIQAIGFVHL